jgi:hypothetical protein
MFYIPLTSLLTENRIKLRLMITFTEKMTTLHIVAAAQLKNSGCHLLKRLGQRVMEDMKILTEEDRPSA